MRLTRRQWLEICGTLGTTLSLGAARLSAIGARQLPPGVGMAAPPPCDPSTKPTPARRLAGFRAGAPPRTEIGAPGGTRVHVQGWVIGLRCGAVAGAQLDVWMATAAGAIDNASRGRVVTDASGRYALTLLVPRSSVPPRIGLRVDVPGKTVISTQVFLPTEIAPNNRRDPNYDDLLLLKSTGRTGDVVEASFDVILDL